jgi:hypothetical protein
MENNSTEGQAEAIEELGTLLGQLEANPNNVPSIQRQITLMKALSMTSEVLDCISRLSALVMLSEGEPQYLG